jgi:hypothetical protein
VGHLRRQLTRVLYRAAPTHAAPEFRTPAVGVLLDKLAARAALSPCSLFEMSEHLQLGGVAELAAAGSPPRGLMSAWDTLLQSASLDVGTDRIRRNQPTTFQLDRADVLRAAVSWSSRLCPRKFQGVGVQHARRRRALFTLSEDFRIQRTIRLSAPATVSDTKWTIGV